MTKILAKNLKRLSIKGVRREHKLLAAALLSLVVPLFLALVPLREQDIEQSQTLEWNLRRYESAGQKWDDLSTGKSCVWKANGWISPYRGYWHCQDCGTSETKTTTCKTLKPRGKCKPFRMQDWDSTGRPRKRSHFRREASDHATSWITTHWDHPTNYELAACSADLTLPCFDLDRCSRDGPMKVYVHHPDRCADLVRAVERASRLLPNDVAPTTHHEEACLLVAHAACFPTKEDMLNDPSYMAGQNHFLWNSGVFFGAHGDRPHPHHFNMELAAVGSGSLTDAQFRPGYDMAVNLPQVWRRPSVYDNLDLHRERRLLLSFKGAIDQNWVIPFESHRWLASEYWYTEPDVYTDVSCPVQGVDYKVKGNEAYGELLLNSTFVFAPGGGGASSYRFSEALAADAIPVVVSYLIPPYSPDVDWSGCVVKVAEARIVDLPRILRNVPEGEVKARRERCRTLYRGVFGRVPEGPNKEHWGMEHNVNNQFFFAMKIWRERIKKAYRHRDMLANVEGMVLDAAEDEDSFRSKYLEESSTAG